MGATRHDAPRGWPGQAWRLAACAALLALGTSGGSGCAAVPVTSFQRARTLGVGHVELGGAVALARRPTDAAVVAQSDEGGGDEDRFAPPIPALHFRLGVAERLDAGLETWPGGLKLSGRYGILDDDQLMLALVGELGWWSHGRPDEDDNGRVSGLAPLLVGFSAPLATRPLPWLELNGAPVVQLMQLQAAKHAYFESQDRSYVSLHTGFTVGANFAVWRVRINPELALLGVYRSDRGEGFWGVYPGVGAFIVF